MIRERIADGTLLSVTDTLNLRHMKFAEPFWRCDTCHVVSDRHYFLDFCDINRNNMERHFSKVPPYGDKAEGRRQLALVTP